MILHISTYCKCQKAEHDSHGEMDKDITKFKNNVGCSAELDMQGCDLTIHMCEWSMLNAPISYTSPWMSLIPLHLL